MQMNLRLVLQFDPILSTQMQTILSPLFFQKNSSKRLLAQLRVKISNFVQRES